MFENRRDAGIKLGTALGKYKDKDVIVLAIPRGGVNVGYEVAKYLNAALSIIVSRKLPFPDNPEAGFGAMTEDGSTFIFEQAHRWLTRSEIEDIVEKQKKEVKRRIDVLRGGKPLPDIKNKIAILVDDGIAMGSTMRAAIMLCRNKKVKKIIIAAPVSGMGTVDEFRKLADEVVILETPPYFHAVAEAYKNWYDVPDKEVIGIIKRWENERMQ